MPLSGAALCEAEIITPKSRPASFTRSATAGVGNTPRLRHRFPSYDPAATAWERNCPDTRGSLAITAWGEAPYCAAHQRVDPW